MNPELQQAVAASKLTADEVLHAEVILLRDENARKDAELEQLRSSTTTSPDNESGSVQAVAESMAKMSEILVVFGATAMGYQKQLEAQGWPTEFAASMAGSALYFWQTETLRGGK